eukprot:Opistho-1_new@3501
MWSACATDSYIPVIGGNSLPVADPHGLDMEPGEWFDNAPFLDTLRGFSSDMYGPFGKLASVDGYGQQQQQQQQQAQYGAYAAQPQNGVQGQHVIPQQTHQAAPQQMHAQGGYVPQPHYMPVVMPHDMHRPMGAYSGSGVSMPTGYAPASAVRPQIPAHIRSAALAVPS